MKSYYGFNMASVSHEFGIYDERTQAFYTFDFKRHLPENPDEFWRGKTTMVRDTPEYKEVLNALAQCLIQMGIVQDSATTAELKATKYHLEDFRKLVFK